MARRAKFVLGLLAAAAPAMGAPLNVPVAARLLAFVRPPVSGAVPAVIIYEPGDAQSEAEALAIEQQIGLAGGAAAVRARRVPVGALSGLSGVRLAFVTSGIREQQQVSGFASRSAVLTITSDLRCVQAGHCVLGVSGTSRTQITVSRAAALASHVRFGSAFLMLVKEV